MRTIKMKHRPFNWMALLQLLILLTATTPAWCADDSGALDPILDLFVKKGFVTRKEVDKVKAEAEFNRTNRLSGASVMSS